MKISKTLVILMLILNSMLFTYAFAENRVGLGFLYGSTESINLIDRTKGAINHVSPTCFDLNDDGTLLITSNLTKAFVDKMHERGVIVTPFLSNHWARQKGQNAINNADVLVTQIINAIAEYNLDGVNVDIENLTEKDRDSLSEFVRILREKMPEGKILSVSVAANPFGRVDGWQGSYDYERLGQYSDYLFIMTYDEHSIGGPDGPVASFAFVEESIKYALNYISKDKIVIGIPFFVRYWKHGEVEEASKTGGDAIVIGAIPSVLESFNVEPVYDENEGEATITFEVTDETEEYKINGKVLTNGTYTIWYPNQDSIILKLQLVNKYDLLGAGVWSLGQEKAEVWSYFGTELNKEYRVPEKKVVFHDHTNIKKEKSFYRAISIIVQEDNDNVKIVNDYKEKDLASWLDEEKALKDGRIIFEEEPHVHTDYTNTPKYDKTIQEVQYGGKRPVTLRIFDGSKKKKVLHRVRLKREY